MNSRPPETKPESTHLNIAAKAVKGVRKGRQETVCAEVDMSPEAVARRVAEFNEQFPIPNLRDSL